MKKFSLLLVIAVIYLCFGSPCFASETACNHDMYGRLFEKGHTELETEIVPANYGCWTLYEIEYQYYYTLCANCREVLAVTKGDQISRKFISTDCMGRCVV